MIFQSIKTTQLTQEKIHEILALKDRHWNYGIKSQLKWFNKFTMENDSHNLMLVNEKIVGYTSLGLRSFEIMEKNNNKKVNKYILFTTLILDKKFRNFSYASKMMNFNNETIVKNKKGSFLLCHNNIINFYKFLGWRQLLKSNFDVPDHKNDLIGMIYNFSSNYQKMNSFLNFYYYS